MKKKITCLLSLTLLMGCTHLPVEEELPEEPPVVEEDLPSVIEWLPKYVKKKDESKDWMVTIQSEIFDLYAREDQKDWRDMLEALVCIQGDEFHNWYNTIYTPTPELSLFEVNINSKDAELVNLQTRRLYDEKLTATGHQYLSCWSFINDDYLSVVIKEGGFIPGSDWLGDIYAYTFDLNTGKSINNIELLNKFSISIEELVEKVKEYYFSQNALISCNEAKSEAEEKYCYTDTSYIKEERIDNFVFFIEKNELYFMGNIRDTRYFSNKIKIKIS